MASSEKPHRILWIDRDESVLAAASRLLADSGWDLVTESSLAKGLSRLDNGQFAVVIADEVFPDGNGIEILKQIKGSHPTASRMISIRQLNQDTLEKAVNSATVFRVIEKPLVAKKVLANIKEGVAHHISSFDQKKLLREVSRQNRELEELKSGLERIVKDRTKSIKTSKAEAEKKQKRIRATIRFVKELSLVSHLDDLFVLIRRELRLQRRVSDPILGYFSPDMRPRLLFFRGNQVLEKQCPDSWPKVDEVRTHSQSVRKFLADQFGRPFGKVLSIPLKQKSADKFSSVLFLEHGFSDDDVHDFLEYVMELLQPFSITLDRILSALELRQISLLWEKTFDTIQDPVAIVNEDFDVLRANRHFSDKVTYGTCYKVFAMSDQICKGCPVKEALETGTDRKGQIRRDDRIYQVHSYPIISGKDKSATTVVNQYVDVTEARGLYSKVIQNEKMAALGVMAGHIAHELNNPLTGLRSLSQILKQELAGTNMANDLNEIEKASERSQRIIKNLLEFSQAGEHSEALDRASLNDIILKTLPMLKTAMRFHNSEIELTEDAVGILVNPYMLQQVIFNLVNNACQAMENPGTVTIETTREDKHVCLYVKDGGQGISDEIVERVFEPFFTTKAEGEGTGLGLSMSRSIIEKFGGTIEIIETGPSGTEFKVSLPATE